MNANTPPPMRCEDANPLLPAFADGQLDLAQTLAIETHSAGCAACSQVLVMQRELGQLVRSHAPYRRMPDALRHRLCDSLPQAEPAGTPLANGEASARGTPVQPGFRRRRDWLRWATPLAAALVLAVGVNSLLTERRARDGLRDEIVAGHVRSLLAAHLDDVISTDQHTVKPWFAGKLDYAPPVHDFASQGYALAGGRLDYIGGHAVAALDYRRRQHVINLYIWPASFSGTAPASSDAQTRAGYNLEHWAAQGMVWWAISDLNADELRDFATLLRAAPKLGGDPAGPKP